MNKPIMPGTVIRCGGQWWKVGMVGVTGGERYYWLTRNGVVQMIPAFMIEIPVVATRLESEGE